MLKIVHGGYELYKKISLESPRGEDPSKDLGVDGMIILKYLLRE